jgi:hypothetical protein
LGSTLCGGAAFSSALPLLSGCFGRKRSAAWTTLLPEGLALLERHPLVLAPQQAGRLLEVDEDLRSRGGLLAIWSKLAPSITVNLL